MILLINCASVRTAHSGSLMLPEVRAAVAQASRQFVSLDELMEGASHRIAELTGAELGMVTCGSAAALTLATAACVAGNDPVKMLRLPFTDGWLNRVIMLKNQRFAFIKGHPKLLGSPYKFAKCGQSGAEISELWPHFRGVVDDVAIIKSMWTDQFNHAPAELFLYTGSSRNGGAARV